MLLLVVALQAAGDPYVIDKVCLGAERVYRVDGEPGSSYLWLLTDADGNNIVLPDPDGTLFSVTDPISGDTKQGSEITINWNTVGNFDLASVQISIHGCDTTEQGKIEVFDLPLAYAGKDATICPGNTFALSESTADHYSSLLWTTTGDGSFDDATIKNPVYTPGPNDIISGSIALTLTAVGLGNATTCKAAESSIIITISKPNLLTLNNPPPVCEPKTVNLTETIDVGLSEKNLIFTYWKDDKATEPLPDYAAITKTGVYYIKAEDANGCSEIKPVPVYIYPQPILVITHPEAVCDPEKVDLSAASIIQGSTIPPLSVFAYWMDAGATVAVSDPKFIITSGTYYIKIVSDGGCFDIQPVTVTINPLPKLAINNPEAVCEPETVDLSDISITSGSDADQYFEYYSDELATTLLTDFKTIALSGTYYIKGINSGTNCSVIRPVNVIVNPQPILVITNPEDICEPETIDLTAAAITQGSDADLKYTYWMDKDGTVELTNYMAVAASGTYYIKATNPLTNCAIIKPVDVVINPVPQLVINQPATECEPRTVDLTAPEITLGSIISASSELTYWLDDLVTKPLLAPETVSKTGTYYIKLQSGFECFVIEAVSVTVNPQPKFVTNNPEVICEPEVVDLFKTIEAEPGQTLTYTYWVDENATIQLPGSIVSAVGKIDYFIRAENEFGCFTIKPVEVIINPEPVLAINNPPAVCFPETVDLTANTVVDQSLLAPASKLTYWMDEMATVELTNPYAVSETRKYYIKLQAGVGCYLIKPVEVEVNSLPIVKITNPEAVCEPATIDLRLASITSGSTSGLSWSYWMDQDAKLPLVNYSAVSATGTYYLMGTNPSTGCSVVEEVNVVVNKPVTPGFNIITDICLNSAPTALPLASIEGITGTWAPSTINTNIKTTTTYTFTPDAGQCALPYKTDITVGDEIIPAFRALGPYCYNSIPDNLPLISDNGVTGSWDPASISTTKVGETVYSFTPSDGKCAKSTTLTIKVYDRIFASVTTENETDPGKEDGRITVYDESGGSNVYEYRLDKDVWQTSPVFANLAPGTYEVWIRDIQVAACPVSLGSFTIYPSGKIIATAVVKHVDCFGDKTGEIRYEKALGGSGSFEYNIGAGWVPFSEPYIRSNLPSGKYTFLLRDAMDHDNQISLEKTIDQPNFWAVNITAQPSGINRANLTARISGSGGTPQYTYFWSDSQKTETAYNLAFGIHKVTVTDAKGCKSEALYNVGFIVSAEIVKPILCPGDKATVRIKAWDGVPPFRLEMNGKTFTNEIDIQIGAGNHSFVVEDYFGVKTRTNELKIIDVLPVTAELKANPVSCSGTNDGEIIISKPAGGSGSPYEYRINKDKWIAMGAATVTIGSLPPNSYHVELREIGSNCIYPEWDLQIVKALPITLTAIGTDAVCYGENGSIKFTFTNVPDGLYDITYTTGLFEDVEIKNNSATVKVKPGDYNNLKLTANRCSSADGVNVKVQDGTELILIASVTRQPDCIVTTGTIEVTSPATGTGYEYSVNGGTTYFAARTFTLAPGDYSVKIKDIATGCESVEIILTINPIPPAPVAPTVVVFNPTCLIPSGTITVTAPLGVAYEYSINGTDYQAGRVFANLSPGSYPVTVKEIATGCVSPATARIVNPVPNIPEAPVSSGNLAECATSPIQTLNANTAIVPVTGIRITWFDNASGGNAVVSPTLRIIGTRTYYAEASNGTCVSLSRTPVTLTINPIPAVPVARVAATPTCNNPDGTVVVTSPLGAEYVYSIDGGVYQASASFTDLVWGDHFIRAKNINTGCESAPGKIEVPAIPPSPELTLVSFKIPICYGDPFTINLSMTNTPDGVYTFRYDGGQFSNVAVSGGTATITGQFNESFKVFNNLRFTANDCNSTGTVNVRIVNPAQLVISNIKVTEHVLKATQKGGIDITVTGGIGTYKYVWSNNATSQDINDISFGEYEVSITDDNNCEVTQKFKVPLNNPPVAIDDDYTFSCLALLEDLLANDFDPEEPEDFITINIVPIVKPLYAQAFRINKDGTFEYLAIPSYNGIDFFVYEISDKHGQTSTARVTITVVSDFDGDGIADVDDPDADGDGILNIYEALPGQDWRTADADGDGSPNYLDIDSDGDGIVDNIEAQDWANYIHPSNIDVNNNGVDDTYDKFQFTREIIPIDTDGDGIPDFLDADSDNDGVPDYIEGHDLNADGKPDRFAIGRDSDGDGLDDAYETVVNECNALGNAVGSNAPMQDFDGDGIPDWRDTDDDNDGYLTKFEDLNGDGDWSNDDLDYDGHPEYLDYGRDCDLFIPDAFSPNGDNIHDYFQIYCINHFPDAKMYIFDQLGNKLFEKAQYGNLNHWLSYDRAWWNGKPEYGPSKARNEIVPPGTYYYVLDLGNGEVKKSYVFISY
ncbi:MAG: gliding motility-associated C-terminal domain-containing protein [Bacteroidota bacterium]|nr:gliding motility-associated C-terminal domain-containing protein [Bacteroidota bacterium]